jgi:hypothetical protein
VFAGLGLGGLIYPPILYAVGPKGRDFPWWLKGLGLFFALLGIGASFVLAKFVYRM